MSVQSLSKRSSAAAAVGLAVALTTGCTQVYLQQPGGGYARVATYANLPGVGPQQIGPPLPPSSPLGHSGRYNGKMQALVSAGARCTEFRPVEGFRVDGRSVAYGPFRGRIANDGSLQMIYGQNWVVGQFGPGIFRGTITYQVPPCQYAMLLQRTAP
jgi:hypothetical protein